jgi:hypothetical protein
MAFHIPIFCAAWPTGNPSNPSHQSPEHMQIEHPCHCISSLLNMKENYHNIPQQAFFKKTRRIPLRGNNLLRRRQPRLIIQLQ